MNYHYRNPLILQFASGTCTIVGFAMHVISTNAMIPIVSSMYFGITVLTFTHSILYLALLFQNGTSNYQEIALALEPTIVNSFSFAAAISTTVQQEQRRK
jgi:hypothetical protein